MSGCWPSLTRSHLVWTLHYKKDLIWHKPVPLLESCCSAQSQAFRISRTASPEEAPWGVQQNSSSFCLKMFVFHMRGPSASHANPLSPCCAVSIPTNRSVAKGFAVAILSCSVLFLPSKLMSLLHCSITGLQYPAGSRGAESQALVGEWVMYGASADLWSLPVNTLTLQQAQGSLN